MPVLFFMHLRIQAGRGSDKNILLIGKTLTSKPNRCVMTKRNTSIAKISCPAVSGIFPRKRLFKLLDRSREKPVIWVSGPAGSGKTTLIASYLDARKLPCLWYQVDEGDADLATYFYYMGLAAQKAAPRYRKPLPLLTPEYMLGAPVFTRRFFEELGKRLKPPCVITLDDYHNVPNNSQFHEIVSAGISSLPRDIQVIVLSRNEPPQAFMRMRANNAMSMLGWNELRFTLEETTQVITAKRDDDPTDDNVAAIHEKAGGWAAGLVLLTGSTGAARSAEGGAGNIATKKIFAYFAGEIIAKLDGETRTFLLLSSFLTRMTAQTAARITDDDNAGKILARLTENNFFTEKHTVASPVYRYHPLFRDFLQERIKSALSREDVVRLQNKAADLLENSGQVEDAAHLFLEARDWGQLVRLALTHAPSLAAQGRNRTLEEWLLAVPAEILEQNPLLLYWLGMCRLPYDLHESRSHFERAYALFKRRHDAAGLYLSWSGVVETYILERSNFTPLDHWISEIEGLLREHPEFPSPEIKIRITAMIFFAMMYRRPDHPDFRLWEERLLAVLPEVEDVGLRTLLSSHLVFYYSWWSGELAKAELLIKDLRHSVSRLSDVQPFAYIVFRANEAAHFMVSGRSDLSQEAVEDALRTAEVTGIRVWDFMLCLFGAHNALSDGDFEKARRFLDRAAPLGNNMRHLEVSHYHFQLAWEGLWLGNTNVALEHVMTALSMSVESGTPFLEGACKTGLSEVLLELGRHEEALKTLEEARAIGRSCNSKTMEFQALLIQTRIFLRLGKTVPATEALRGHLTIGRECGIYSTPWWRPAIMAEMYSHALEEGIETQYVREVIRRWNLVPDPPPVEIGTWPWPVRIRTLGGFELQVNDQRVTFPGKAQKKPLELLKALISLGGNDVPESDLNDALWPDSEGDSAHSAFTTTLSRLRQLLGNEKAVLIEDGKASLDPHFCWVDAWAFERMVEKSEDQDRRKGEEKTRRSGPSRERTSDASLYHLLEKTISLYRGSYLASDARMPWTLSMRERLRNKFQKLVGRAGELRERSGQWEHAIACYQKAMEMDELSEEIAQRLMACQLKLERYDEAITTYRRCKRMLIANFGIDPSEKTETLYQSALRKNK